MTDTFLLRALFISLTLHTVLVCGSYWIKIHELKKVHDRRVEIIYKSVKPPTLDIPLHVIKPARRLDLKNIIDFKLNNDSQDLKGFTRYERKPTQIKSTQVNLITVTPIQSKKIDSSTYISYQERIRESIKERVYANYNRFDAGIVYLTFIISSDGRLKAYQVVDEKTKASQNLRYISTKSLKEAQFPPFLKGMTLPEYTFNIEIEYQVSE